MRDYTRRLCHQIAWTPQGGYLMAEKKGIDERQCLFRRCEAINCLATRPTDAPGGLKKDRVFTRHRQNGARLEERNFCIRLNGSFGAKKIIVSLFFL